MVKRLNAYKVINQLTKITFFINVTKFFRKKRKKITTIRIEVIFLLPFWVTRVKMCYFFIIEVSKHEQASSSKSRTSSNPSAPS